MGRTSPTGVAPTVSKGCPAESVLDDSHRVSLATSMSPFQYFQADRDRNLPRNTQTTRWTSAQDRDGYEAGYDRGYSSEAAAGDINSTGSIHIGSQHHVECAFECPRLSSSPSGRERGEGHKTFMARNPPGALRAARSQWERVFKQQLLLPLKVSVFSELSRNLMTALHTLRQRARRA